MQRGGDLTQTPGSEYWGLEPGRIPQVEAYRALMRDAAVRRRKEGRADSDPDLVMTDSRWQPLLDREFQKDPAWVSRYLAAKPIARYIQAAEEHGIDLFTLEKPNWLKQAQGREDEWLKKSPLDRYAAIETDRAEQLAKQWKGELDAIPAGANCLDVGCGSGFFVRHMRKLQPDRNWQATDLKKNMPITGTDFDRTRESWFAPCEEGKPLPYPDASQDVVMLGNVLHHIDPKKLDTFVAELGRILKPGGKLLVTEEYAGKEFFTPGDRVFPMSDDAKMHSRVLDPVFWSDEIGHHQPVNLWKSLLGKGSFFRHGGDTRVVGTYGTPGLPILEACITMKRNP
jgi:SAM-dependent methyltransferase